MSPRRGRRIVEPARIGLAILDAPDNVNVVGAQAVHEFRRPRPA